MNALRWYAVIGAAVGAAGLPIFQIMYPTSRPRAAVAFYESKWTFDPPTRRVTSRKDTLREWASVSQS